MCSFVYSIICIPQVVIIDNFSDVAQSSEDNDSLPNISLDEQNESLPDILFDIPDDDENLDDQTPEKELDQDVACSYHDKTTEMENTEYVHPGMWTYSYEL